MRKLEFRAWDTKRNTYDHEELLLAPNGDILASRWQELREPESVYIIEPFTGLKDKNGKEIYEGDIVEFRERAYEVKFDNYGQFRIENKNYHWLENGYSFRSVDIWCADGILVEVIGNIHERKELLEVKDVD